jgi:hypothetical protein
MSYNIKKQILLLSILFYSNVQINAQKKIFIRIYPIGASGIIKGLYLGHTDSSLVILSKQQPDTVSYLNIQQIKTRRSTGHHILISVIIGSIAGTVTGLLTHKNLPPSDPNCQLCGIIDYSFRTTPSEDAISGALLGVVAGTAIGTVIGLTKKRETLIVAGDFEKWKAIRTKLEVWPVYLRGSNSK